MALGRDHDRAAAHWKMVGQGQADVVVGTGLQFFALPKAGPDCGR